MQEWFHSHGMNINALPPFQYSLDCPHLNMTKVEKNRVIQTDIHNTMTIHAYVYKYIHHTLFILQYAVVKKGVLDL